MDSIKVITFAIAKEKGIKAIEHMKWKTLY
jgi:hypothetical protein